VTPPDVVDGKVDGVVEGIDAPRVTEWFEEKVEGVKAPLHFSLVAGGRSNLTYRVTDSAGNAWALRRPPVSHVLPTAHDMAREHKIMSALGPTDVPVPRTVGLCEDPEVNGAPFYVMEFVDGFILRDASVVEQSLGEPERRIAGESVADTLAKLHAVDVDSIGLGDFARRDGYIERQLKRWMSQYENSPVEGFDSAGLIVTAHDRLAAAIPEQTDTSIVHGDYRLDNVVIGPDGHVRAVLDWEICTLGDPLADVGLLMVYWTEPGERPVIQGTTPTAVAGFPDRAEMQRLYTAASGRSLSSLDFYVAFGYWKLACILQGVYHRYMGGAAAGDRSGIDGFGPILLELATTALDVLDGRPRDRSR
jgi:aminoglycoside phosphotransferase (APT) family kinase protein